LKIQDVESEQKKYNNFWIGIQRRVAMQKTHMRYLAPQITAKERAVKMVHIPLISVHQAFVHAHVLTSLQIFLLQRKNRWIFHPLNDNKVTWDFVIIALVIYSVITIPIKIGFNMPPVPGIVAFEAFIDCMFFLDMCATFNTAYLNVNTETYVYSRAKIAKNYVKFWFWIDLVSTIPFDDLMQLLTSNKAHFAAIRAIRILRLGRLAKLQRLNKLSDYLEEKLGIGPSQMNLVMLMLQIFFVAHLFACFWHYLALPSEQTNRTWLTEGKFDMLSAADEYVAALYYTIVTMLTVGYGDIHPTNPQERAYSVFTMLSGGVIFGALLSKVASVIEKRHPQARAFKENMDEVRAFLDEYSLPIAVKAKAKVKSFWPFLLLIFICQSILLHKTRYIMVTLIIIFPLFCRTHIRTT
jgi:hypothetical protein